MELSRDDFRALARAVGLTLDDAQAEALKPAVERALDLLAHLDTVDVGSTEPSLFYRIGG